MNIICKTEKPIESLIEVVWSSNVDATKIILSLLMLLILFIFISWLITNFSHLQLDFVIEDTVHDYAHRGGEEVGGHDDAEENLLLEIRNRHKVIINWPSVWNNGQSKGHSNRRGHEGQKGLWLYLPTNPL